MRTVQGHGGRLTVALLIACGATLTLAGLVGLTVTGDLGHGADRWYIPVLVFAVVASAFAGVRDRREHRPRVALTLAALVVATAGWFGGVAALRAPNACMTRGSTGFVPYRLDLGLDLWQGGVSCAFVPEQGEPRRIVVPLHELI